MEAHYHETIQVVSFISFWNSWVFNFNPEVVHCHLQLSQTQIFSMRETQISPNTFVIYLLFQFLVDAPFSISLSLQHSLCTSVSRANFLAMSNALPITSSSTNFSITSFKGWQRVFQTTHYLRLSRWRLECPYQGFACISIK